MISRTASISDIATDDFMLGIPSRDDAAPLDGEAEGAAEVELGADIT